MINTNKVLKIFLFIAGLSAIVLTSGKIFNLKILDKENDKQKQPIILTEQTAFFPDLVDDFSYFEHDTISDCYFLYNSKNKLECYVLLTMPYCKDIEGFGGCVPIAIVFNPDDKIRELYLLDNCETPSWIESLNDEGFFDLYKGMTCEEVLSTEINAVTGATFSSEAIIKSCSKRLSIYAKTDESNKSKGWLKTIGLIVSFLFLIFAVYSFVFPKNANRYRIFLLIASIGILGFWQGNFLSLALLHNWLINGMKIWQQIFLFIVLIFSIVLPLVTNKSFYCQFVCPFGAAQELMGKLNKRKVTFSKPLTKILRNIRFVFLIFLLLMTIVAIDFSLEYFEPFSAFKFQFASASVLILALVILFLSIFINKPWCRFFCPTGALLSLFRGKSKKGETKQMNISLLINIILAISVLLLIYLNFIKNDNSETVETNKETIIMNNTIEVIQNRKSVRHFKKDEIIKNEDLKTIVKAGMAAPTARNLQPWSFIVITKRETLDELGKALPYAKMLFDSPAAIVVCGDMDKAATDVDSSYWIQDCSAATENILLAVESMNLGAVWTGVYPYTERMEPVIEILNLPDNIKPLNVIPIGVPTGEDKSKDKWKEENLHWEKW